MARRRTDNAPESSENVAQAIVEQVAEATKMPEEPKKYAPDPQKIANDLIARVQLFESRQDRQMAFKFGSGALEDKPSDDVLTKLKDHGYRWSSEHKVWTKPIRQPSAMTTRIEAERLFKEISSDIRQQMGVEHSHGMGIPD